MRRMLALLGILVTIAAACSSGETTAGKISAETLEIRMRDSAFVPKTLTVRRGQEIRFEFENEGAVKHDAFIGDKDAQKDHEQEMRMQDDEKGMDADHGEHGMTTKGGITIGPGKHGTLTHRFTKKGTFYIGCHQAGHYAAGMKMRITVR